MTFEESVFSWCKEQELIEAGDTIVVGLSGGADSVCLLRVLEKLQQKIDFSLRAVHVHHGIRGEEADADQKFVEQLCDRLSIPLEVYREDVPKLARQENISTEEAGRNVRYARMEQVAKRDKQGKIAVAHHQNDQVETVLHHLCRGTGLQGMGGMTAKRGRIIRPFLQVTKTDILEYLSAIQQAYCEDSTNQDLVYTRNRLRQVVIPMLQAEVNPQTSVHIAQLALEMQEAYDFIAQAGESLWAHTVHKIDASRIELSLKAIKNQPALMQKWIVKRILEELSPMHKNIERQHILDTISLFDKQSGRSIDLAEGLQVEREYETIIFQRGERKTLPEPDENIEMVEKAPFGILENKKWKIQWRIFSVEEVGGFTENGIKKIPKNNCTKWFDYDKIKGTVTLRNIQKKDCMQIDSMGHHKDALQIGKDLKIAAKERRTLSVLAVENTVLWILGVRSGQDFLIDTHTKRILEMICEKKEDKV